MSSDASDEIALTIFCPIRPSLADPSQLEYVENTAIELAVPAKSTVDDVKAQLEREMQGSPAKHGQTLIYRGRLLMNDELIAVATADSRNQQEADVRSLAELARSQTG
jgi:hypothetical protein